MARIPERKFDPAQPVIARKYFTANGRKYSPGMDFPWRKDAISQRRVMQMFDAGKITHEGKMMVESAPKEPEVIVEDKITPERINEEVTPERIDEELPDPGDHWHYVDEDDLDAIDDMKELRIIADAEGAPYKVSKADQRQAIRDNRKGDGA